MNILFVCGGSIMGGKERQTLDYMLEMKRRGHHVFCVISSWNTGEFPKLLTEHNIPHEAIRLGFISFSLSFANIRMTLHQLMYLPSLYSAYRRIIKKWKPDVVVHTNFQYILMLLPLLTGKHDVFHVHDVIAVSGKFKWLFRQFNKKINVFVGVSEFICRNVASLAVPNEKIKLIYNGIRIPETSKHISTDVPVIGIVGQIGSWKGHDLLIDALQLLKDLSWRLHIIGYGDESYINMLKDKIVRTGLSERIEFKGSRSGLSNIYSGIDISCVPSFFEEPFGLVAAEPALFQIPVVVTNRGGLPEIVIDGETGLVVPSGDPVQLAAALRRLLNNPAERNQFGLAAKQRVEKLFNIETSGAKLEDLLFTFVD